MENELLTLLKDIYNDKIKRVDNDINKIEKDIGKLFDRNNENAKKQGIIETQLNNVITIMSEMKTKIDVIAQKPVKRWDTLTNAAITVIVSICIYVVLGKIL